MNGVLPTLALTIQMLSALAMVGLILIQHGKGADMGAAFGSGASGSLFGATGGANFLSRTTAVLAAVFLVSTLVLSMIGSQRVAPPTGSVLERAPATTTAPAPATTPAAPPATAPASDGAASQIPAGASTTVPVAPGPGADSTAPPQPATTQIPGK